MVYVAWAGSVLHCLFYWKDIPGLENGGTFVEMVVTKMKRFYGTSGLILTLVFVIVLLVCAGCGQTGELGSEEGTGEIVVEPGIPSADPNEPAIDPEDSDDSDSDTDQEPDGPAFMDRGEDSTLEDIAANLALVESYYFEQNVPYVDGHVYMQIWYKDGLMKLVTSVDGYGLSEYYYDYNDGTVINYAPGNGTVAMKMSFDANGDDAPDNPKLQDYLSCTVEGFETIDRQTCMILTTPEGSQLWVSTETGFPLQVHYEDSLGDLWTVQYKNIRLNDVADEDLLLDPSVEVVDYTDFQVETGPDETVPSAGESETAAGENAADQGMSR